MIIPVDLYSIGLSVYLMVAGLWLSLLFHEYGHVFAFKRFGYDVPVYYIRNDGFNVGHKGDYMVLSNDQKQTVYLTGILFGFIPLIPLSMYIYPSYSIGALIIYLFGCKHDVKQIMSITLWR